MYCLIRKLTTILCKLYIIIFLLDSPVYAQTQKLDSLLDGGVGLACEKEGNTNRKVYRSFFKFSKGRKIVATLDYRNDKPLVTSVSETTATRVY